jgi:N-acetylglucosaminyl-diphospho-decaprenol L-rhamnosyltransferase
MALVIDLSIIIVSWNVAGELAACLDSILAVDAPHIEIIVVDSASSDNTVTMLQERYPQVKLVAQTENLGFVRCNNIGLRMAQGRYLMLLNPDTEAVGDALAQMVTYMDAHPEVGIAGPHTLNTDRTTQSTRRRFPTLAIAFFESTWLQPYAPKSMLDSYYVNDQPDNGRGQHSWHGAASMSKLADSTKVISCSPKKWIGATGPKTQAGAWSMWAQPKLFIMAARVRIR